MKVAVLSGKGGTGKTFIAVNLAAIADKSTYIDCDVEAPNGYLFLKPEQVEEVPVEVFIPQVDQAKCKGCRVCEAFCQFNAIAFIREKPLVFDTICHSCGGCTLLCPHHAMMEVSKKIGVIQKGQRAHVKCVSGLMEIGEASGVPIIEKLLEEVVQEEDLVIIDCSPGSGCLVMESVKEADYCLLVAEPTVFGAHNLEMVHELVSVLDKPFGVVLNKVVEGQTNPSEVFCTKHQLPILAQFPFDEQVAKLGAEGEMISLCKEDIGQAFKTLLQSVRKEGMK